MTATPSSRSRSSAPRARGSTTTRSRGRSAPSSAGRCRRPPDRARRRAVPFGGEDRRWRRAVAARADRARAAPSAEVPGCARRRQRGPARPARRRVLRHRLSLTVCRRPPRPTRCPRCGASAGAFAATASTASRTPGSPGASPSCSEAGAGAADRQLPSRRRARRCARSPAGARSTRRWASHRSRAW